jgi:hypothetical protein
MKKPGDNVSLYAPRMAEELQKFCSSHGYGREAYVRVEGKQAVLYFVTRDSTRTQSGNIHASITIPLLPEEV